MLFSRREPPLDPSFTQRFSSKLGEYFAPAKPRNVKGKKNKPTISVDACYALLGEKTEGTEFKFSELQTQLAKLTKKYEKKTGKWLELEQFALAAVKVDAQQQAETLRHHFIDQDLTDCTLFSEASTSVLRLAMISDALGITRFSDTTAQPTISEFKACRHMLNVVLSDIAMQDLETCYRDLGQSCSEAMTERGADTDSLQSCWKLRLRYADSDNSLLMKCMPLEMLRETFHSQYKKKYGQAHHNQEILIEALEVTAHCSDEGIAGAPVDSGQVKQFMKDWQSSPTESEVIWSKSKEATPTNNMDYLDCPILHKMLSVRVIKTTDAKLSELFIQKV